MTRLHLIACLLFVFGACETVSAQQSKEELPAGGADRGSQKWSAGPSLVTFVQHGDWTFGILVNNTWSCCLKVCSQERNN